MSITTSPDQGTNVGPLVQVMAADGAIAVPAVQRSLVVITKGTALAGTLVAPTSGTDDYKILIVTSTTAAAHVITTPANKIQDGSTTTKDTATFAAHVGGSIEMMAYGGLWYVINTPLNVTLTEV